jgi:diguanylate cyclase (GGDEF)-like protein/PAS domain S-box-containing protein
MFIEIRTLFVVYVVFNVLGVVVMVTLWQQNRKRSPEIALWLFYYVLQLVALLLVTLRGVVPDIVSIVFANALIVGGTFVLYVGLERYVGEKSRHLHNYVMVAAFILIHAYLTFVYPSLTLRNVNLSLALLYISAQGAWLMLRRVHPSLLPATRATGIVLAALCVVSVAQVIDNLTKSPTDSLFTSDFFGAMAIMAYQTIFVALTFALFLLVNRRLLTALESELTGHQRTEDTLRESRQQFQGLVETLYDWVWEVDSRGHYTYVSPQIKNILGYEPQEIIGQTPYDLMAPEEAGRVSEVFGALIKEGKPLAALENINIHKDGHAVVIETNGRPFYDVDGKFKGYRGTDRDITNRKQAQETLKKSEEQVRLLLNSTAEAIYGIDLNGDCTFVNPSCLTMLGYADAEQMLGKNMHNLIHHSYPGGLPMRVEDCRIYRAFHEGKGVHVDDEVLWRADGTSFPVEYWSYPQIVNNVVSGAVVAFIDITDRRQAEEGLRQSEEKFSRAFQTSPYAIAISRLADGKFVEVNDAFVSFTGFSREEIARKSSVGLNLWVDENDEETVLSLLREGAAVVDREYMFRGKNGEVLTGLFSAQMIQLREGPCILSSIDNITERKRMEEDLHKNRRFLSDLIEYSGALICVKDRHGRYELVNRKWEEMTGRKRQEVLGKTDEESFPGPVGEQFRANDLEVIESRSVLEKEEILEGKEGKRYFLSVKFPLHDDKGVIWGVCGMMTEITERKLAEEQIHHMATHDMLTGLPSLRLAKDRLSVALGMAHRYQKMTAVMFIDLDGFKVVNDTMGHDAGDYVLKQVAKRLLSCVRETDTVARVGGDEFLIIATELRSTDDAARIAKKIIQSVSRPVAFNRQPAAVSASIGIAFYPDQGEDMEKLIKQADDAMYRVKNTGKNGFAFANTAIK